MVSKIQWIGDNLHPPAIINVDLGNALLKVSAYITKDNGAIEERTFAIPHGYYQMSSSEWIRREDNTSGASRTPQSHIFKIQLPDETYQAVSIGKHAFISSQNAPLLGSNKYIHSGIDALLCAVFCELFPKRHYPKGHNNIVLGYGYPPTEYQQRSLIGDLLTKTHRIVDHADDKRAFRVRVSVAWDENAGGLVNAISINGRNPDNGQFAENTFESNDRVIVLDCGGWLGSMAWANVDDKFASIDYASRIASIDGGIYTVRSELREVLKTIPELRGVRDTDMTEDLLNSILLTRELSLSGNKPQAMNKYIDQSLSYIATIKKTYVNEFASGKFAKHILLTGGTSHVMYDYLVNMLAHNSIHLAARRSEIHMANVKGGMLILLDRLIADNLMPPNFQKAMQ